jgi:hypothetical protein
MKVSTQYFVVSHLSQYKSFSVVCGKTIRYFLTDIPLAIKHDNEIN